MNASSTRRRFMERLAQSALGLTILYAPGRAADPTQPAIPGFGSAKRIIFINVKGGLSHIDTLDPKRGDVKGPGDPIKTSADFRLTSYLPKTARIAHQIALVRTMTAKVGVHGPAQYFMRTAFAPRNTIKHPNLGAWAQHYLGPSHDTLPSSACVNGPPRHGNGFFPPSYSPLPVLDPETGLDNVRRRGGVSELEQHLGLAKALSGGFLDKYADRNVKAYREFYDHSLRLLKSKELDAFDLTREPAAMREAYGETKFGQGCLLARRLVETDIRFVEVTSDGWDMHKNLEADMEDMAPVFDQAYAALIADLVERGLFDSTLVVLATEFGRKAKFEGGGRGHYPICFSMGLAGAGIKRGFVYGESDARGMEGDKPVTVGDFHATIGHAAGLPREEAESPSGRPFVVGGTKAKVLAEMFT